MATVHAFAQLLVLAAVCTHVDAGDVKAAAELVRVDAGLTLSVEGQCTALLCTCRPHPIVALGFLSSPPFSLLRLQNATWRVPFQYCGERHEGMSMKPRAQRASDVRTYIHTPPRLRVGKHKAEDGEAD